MGFRSYPDFYRAWHGLTETQTSPLIQTLNLAQLPQLFCIDRGKFDHPDRAANHIY